MSAQLSSANSIAPIGLPAVIDPLPSKSGEVSSRFIAEKAGPTSLSRLQKFGSQKVAVQTTLSENRSYGFLPSRYADPLKTPITQAARVLHTTEVSPFADGCTFF